MLTCACVRSCERECVGVGLHVFSFVFFQLDIETIYILCPVFFSFCIFLVYYRMHKNNRYNNNRCSLCCLTAWNRKKSTVCKTTKKQYIQKRRVFLLLLFCSKGETICGLNCSKLTKLNSLPVTKLDCFHKL